jgi:hypothetical protein
MADFKTVLVKDSTIGDITPDYSFAVKSGAQNVTYQQFVATSASNSALIYSIQVPSESIVIDRAPLLRGTIAFRDLISNVPVGQSAFSYGETDCVQSFPLNSLFTTATAQINNTSVSVNLQDIKDALLKMTDTREILKYNGMTPSLPDSLWGSYSLGVGSTSNVLASANTTSYDVDQLPRGAYPATVTLLHNITGGGQDGSPISTDILDTWVATIVIEVCEPLMLSPFIWGNPEFNSQGLLGINNMTFTLNIDASLKRLFSTANVGYTHQLVAGTATNNNLFAPASQPSMLLKFLSSQPSDLLQSKNVCPYMDTPRYLTSQSNNPIIPSVGQATIVTGNLQINQIPDYFVIYARKPMAQQTCKDTAGFLTIKGVSINLNNQSGLLSSISQQDLFRMSQKNGYNGSYQEFSGVSFVNNNATGVGEFIPTLGSVLVINPAYDLSLPDYLSSGSIGNYNFQAQLQVFNQYGEDIQCEVVVLCVNSGIFVTEQGVSSTYTGLLTKELVMEAKTSQKERLLTSVAHARMIGGKFLHRMSSAVHGMHRPHPIAHKVAEHRASMGAPRGGLKGLY